MAYGNCPKCKTRLRRLVYYLPKPKAHTVSTNFLYCEKCEKIYKQYVKEVGNLKG